MRQLKAELFFIYVLPRFAVISFIAMVVIGMKLYPGGIYHMVSSSGQSMCPGESCTHPNHLTSGYMFSKNFLSDLGRTFSHSKENNFHSSLLFNMSLTLAGTIYILFYIYLVKLFKSNIISKLGSLFGICGAVCFIGVAFTPADLFLQPHIFFNLWIFRFFLLSMFLYSWLIFKDKDIDNKYLIGNIVFILSLIFYILVLTFGPTPRDPGGLEFQAISQKFIMFNFFISIIIQSVGFKHKIVNNY